MLSETAFLRRVPTSVGLEDRLILDGLATSSDLVFIAGEKLLDALRRLVGRPVGPLSRRERLELGLYCWSIVDNMHSFRYFDRRVPNVPEHHVLSKMIEATEAFSIMRNVMDHRHQNIANSAKVKGAVHPIYGAVSFYEPDTDANAWKVHQISLAGVQHPRFVMPIVDTWAEGKIADISRVSLAAFDLQIDLSDELLRLQSVLEQTDHDLEEGTTAAIRALVEQNQVDAAELLSPHPEAHLWVQGLIPKTLRPQEEHPPPAPAGC